MKDIQLDRYHLSILTRLFNHGYIGGRHTSKDSIVKNFPKSDRGNAKKALERLIIWNLVLPKKTSAGDHVMLNPDRIDVIKENIERQNLLLDNSPIEDLVGAGYEKKAFHISETQRNIKGVHSKYSYHKQLADETCIRVYIYNEKGENVYNVLLGSFNDPESLLYRSVQKMDELFKGRVFSRMETYELRKDITGNNQQLKGILDMLVYYHYLISIDKGKYFQRTSKKLPKVSLDEYPK